MGLLLMSGLFGGKAAYGKYKASEMKLEDRREMNLFARIQSPS